MERSDCAFGEYDEIRKGEFFMQVPTIATLTAIPPRFDGLRPTLNSLLGQTLPFAEIRLYIPLEYRRFPEWDGMIPEVPEGITITRCPTDFGPATKVLPAAQALRGRNVDLLFCDDDKIYDRHWHRRFKNCAALKPGTCIVEAGETFPDIADSVRPANRLPRGRRERKNWLYRLKRVASLGLLKPHTYRNSGYVDQISGYGGVLVRPGWLDDRAFDIPDVMWTVDDPWLSGHLELVGIPIWLNGRGKQPKASSVGNRNALLKFEELGQGRIAADLMVIEYFRMKYGIWQRGGQTEKEFGRMTASMKALARRA